MTKVICIKTVLLFVTVFACTNFKRQWVSERIDNKHVSWDGSYENGINCLKLVYHGWKIFKNDNNEYEMRFRAKIYFRQSKEYDKPGGFDSSSIPVMPINQIIYRFYDSDDFVIDSINLESTNNYANYKDTTTFQSKANIDKIKISKIKYGKIQISAGYATNKLNGNIDEIDFLIQQHQKELAAKQSNK